MNSYFSVFGISSPFYLQKVSDGKRAFLLICSPSPPSFFFLTIKNTIWLDLITADLPGSSASFKSEVEARLLLLPVLTD